MDKIQAAFF